MHSEGLLNTYLRDRSLLEGGWKSKETLLRCYQQPDEATMLNVVLSGLELRERRA